jgi:striatin 1/3/4
VLCLCSYETSIDPQARIALLEGQRRSAENLKVDLLRRVKMLEYALRQER